MFDSLKTRCDEMRKRVATAEKALLAMFTTAALACLEFSSEIASYVSTNMGMLSPYLSQEELKVVGLAIFFVGMAVHRRQMKNRVCEECKNNIENKEQA